VSEALPPIEPAAFLRDEVAARVRRRVEELRAQIARLEGELDDRLGAEATIELVLEGEGGGRWCLNLRQGDVTVTTEPETPPLVRVYQSRADWEALARAAQPGSGADLTRTRIARLRGLEGAIAFLLTDDDAERRIVVQLGPGERPAPRCTIAVRAETARRLQSGELTPQAAFMQGLVVIQGDIAFAMQLGGALFL
jgi:hypothetical protein